MERVPEGLTPGAIGEQIGEHGHEAGREARTQRRDRTLSIAEAVLLSVVALTAAWSGYAAAKWNTEASVHLAEASALRAKANRAGLEAMELRNFDSSTFEAWFAAFTAGNQQAIAIAERRFRPEFRVAFDAWMATNPDTNPAAPPGPTFMPEYEQPLLAEATELDSQAEAAFSTGTKAGQTSDKYVRTTVFLASVLFLVGISTHFPLHNVRFGLIGLAAVLLVVAFIQLAQLPRPPS